MSARLNPRLWDSEFFGFPVAEIKGREIDEGLLTADLLESKRAGFELVYWQSEARCKVSESVLDRFVGQLVDRRLTYRLSLDAAVEDGAPPAGQAVTEYPAGAATSELVELATAAGEFSRFKVDPRFSPALFEALYRTWIERSTLHEIADAVLIAPSGAGGVRGIATLTAHPPSGTIGLISVHGDSRGQGVGRALMAASHRWMADHGIREASVTTQESNRRACALYERCGYQVADRSLIYHFWPMQGL
jgi:ribosomal protein S18 acetylase RimI-like enzyme